MNKLHIRLVWRPFFLPRYNWTYFNLLLITHARHRLSSMVSDVFIQLNSKSSYGHQTLHRGWSWPYSSLDFGDKIKSQGHRVNRAEISFGPLVLLAQKYGHYQLLNRKSWKQHTTSSKGIHSGYNMEKKSPQQYNQSTRKAGKRQSWSH